MRAALALGVTDRTLERIIERRLGVTPGEMAAKDPIWVAERFKEWL